MPGAGEIYNLGAFAVLVLLIIWTLRVGIPGLMKDRASTTEAFVEALKESRQYHREDKTAMRDFMAKELGEQRKAIGGLARSIERNTVATQAASRGDDVDKALTEFTNGSARQAHSGAA